MFSFVVFPVGRSDKGNPILAQTEALQLNGRSSAVALISCRPHQKSCCWGCPISLRMRRAEASSAMMQQNGQCLSAPLGCIKKCINLSRKSTRKPFSFSPPPPNTFTQTAISHATAGKLIPLPLQPRHRLCSIAFITTIMPAMPTMFRPIHVGSVSRDLQSSISLRGVPPCCLILRKRGNGERAVAGRMQRR